MTISIFARSVMDFATKPVELRQFNNVACLVIHSIENNPSSCRNNYCNVSVIVLSLDSEILIIEGTVG